MCGARPGVNDGVEQTQESALCPQWLYPCHVAPAVAMSPHSCHHFICLLPFYNPYPSHQLKGEDKFITSLPCSQHSSGSFTFKIRSRFLIPALRARCDLVPSSP